jgi:NADH:ubiquinone reductase (H+-translocating)
MLATIGRAQAVAQIGLIHTSGPQAWAFWCVVHIFFLIELRKRIRVMSEWTWYYLTSKPGARLLCEQPANLRKISPNSQTHKSTAKDRVPSQRTA